MFQVPPKTQEIREFVLQRRNFPSDLRWCAKVTNLERNRLGALKPWGMGGKGSDDGGKNLETSKKCRLFQVHPWSSCRWTSHLADRICVTTNWPKKTGVCGLFPKVHAILGPSHGGGLASANSPCDFLLAPDKKPLTDHSSDFLLSLVSWEDITTRTDANLKTSPSYVHLSGPEEW